MKKIVIAISILLLCGCKGLVHEDKTLSDYVTSHDSAHLKCTGCGELRFYAQNIKCDEIKDKEIKYYDGQIIVFNDNTIYETIFDSDKLYSNNSQCRKVEFRLNIDSVILYRNNLLIKSGDNYYTYKRRYNSYVFEFNSAPESVDSDEKQLINENYSIIGWKSRGKTVLLKDGNLYDYNYYNDDMTEVTELELYISEKEYGYIRKAKIYNEIEINDENKSIPSQIGMLITDNGVYVLTAIETEECLKYADVDCELRLVKSEIYDKYKDDIRYIGTDYTILKDGNIIKSSIFSRTLKEKNN